MIKRALDHHVDLLLGCAAAVVLAGFYGTPLFPLWLAWRLTLRE